MKKIGIGIVGLGNIGSRLYKEIISKKNDIGLQTNTNISKFVLIGFLFGMILSIGLAFIIGKFKAYKEENEITL